MPNDKPVNRRTFFRVGLRQLLEPLVEAADPIQKAAWRFDRAAPAPRRGGTSTTGEDRWLRPPGARVEADFRATCGRSGTCVAVCPAKAIKIDPDGEKGGGAPYIDADEMPCVVCDGLYCMQGCPSGALMAVPMVDINMGLADWRESSCLRSNGQDCTICIDKCPLGSAAITLTDGRVNVIEKGCIGCGVCQHECPTSPKSIRVISHR